uniref:Olfactory receptor class A related 5 n=1 Tax=Cyprinus carpio carpio TaxID=630221 RepID=A0A9J7Z0S3_CYPCA
MIISLYTHGVLFSFFCCTGIIGNSWLGLRSLPKSGSQLRTGDVLLVNLAVSNLITNCLVDLPETVAHFAKSWLTSKEYCSMTQFSHELSETSSIFSTMFISVYWHQKLVGSIRRGGAPVQMDNLRLVGVLLTGSWIVSTAFSLPHVFIAEHNANESSEVCEERFASPAAKQTFDGVYLTLANVVPMIGITYATVQIVLTLLRSQKRIKDLSRNGANPQPSSVDQKLEAEHGIEESSPISADASRAAAQQKTQVRSNTTAQLYLILHQSSFVSRSFTFTVPQRRNDLHKPPEHLTSSEEPSFLHLSITALYVWIIYISSH